MPTKPFGQRALEKLLSAEGVAGAVGLLLIVTILIVSELAPTPTLWVKQVRLTVLSLGAGALGGATLSGALRLAITTGPARLTGTAGFAVFALVFWLFGYRQVDPPDPSCKVDIPAGATFGGLMEGLGETQGVMLRMSATCAPLEEALVKPGHVEVVGKGNDTLESCVRSIAFRIEGPLGATALDVVPVAGVSGYELLCTTTKEHP